MAKLDEELVAAFVVEKFNVTQAEAWEFIDSIKAQAKVESDAEAAEKAASMKESEALWEAIKRLENENKELQKRLAKELDKE